MGCNWLEGRQSADATPYDGSPRRQKNWGMTLFSLATTSLFPNVLPHRGPMTNMLAVRLRMACTPRWNGWIHLTPWHSWQESLEKVRLGISVLIVPYRHPFDVARRVATVDLLSGGRFVLGVGVGWLEDEFRLLEIPFKERAQRTREYLTVMKLFWTQEKPRFSGKFVQVS